MKLTRAGEYGVRCILFLAVNGQGTINTYSQGDYIKRNRFVKRLNSKQVKNFVAPPNRFISVTSYPPVFVLRRFSNFYHGSFVVE